MSQPPAPLAALAERLAAHRETLDAAALTAIRARYPNAVRAMTEAGAAAGLRQTTGLLIATLAGRNEEVQPEMRMLAEQLGARSADAELPVEQLSGTLRIYQREAWTVVGELVGEMELPADAVMALAISSLGFADGFTHLALESYAAADARRSARRIGARQSLLTTLLAGHPEPASLAPRAEACGWHLPGRARVAVRHEGSERWPADALAGQWAQYEVAILTDLRPNAQRWACGPEVELSMLPTSLDAAVRMFALPTDAWPAMWEDCLIDLVLTGDRVAGAAFATDILEPLARASARQREWLYDTLEAWLDHRGSPTRIAEIQHLHPQSVRYRIAQLRKIFGDGLDDLDTRFRLKVALQLRRLLELQPDAS